MATKILVVDDSSTIQKVIRIALSKFALEVVAAGSYLDALSMISELQPDVVLADCALIGTKVPEDFTRLAMEAGGAPMILLVGSFEEFDENAFRSSGFKQFVHKPFESSDIVKAVGDALGMPLTYKKSPTLPPMASADVLGQADLAPVKPTGERLPPRPSEEPHVELNRGVPPPPVFKPRAPAPVPPPPAPAMEKSRPFASEGSDGSAVSKGSEKVKQFHMDDEDTSEIDSSRFVPLSSVNVPIDRILQDTQTLVVKAVQAELEHQLPAQVEVAVRRYLEAYCERHFKTLAKEILIAEIRRLTDEKARQALEG